MGQVGIYTKKDVGAADVSRPQYQGVKEQLTVTGRGTCRIALHFQAINPYDSISIFRSALNAINNINSANLGGWDKFIHSIKRVKGQFWSHFVQDM